MSGNTTVSTPNSLDLVAFLSDAETRDLIQSMVYDLEVQNTEVRMGGIDDVLEYVAALPSWPKQLLIDISDSPLALSDMNRVADVMEPGTRIVVVGERNDVGLFRDLMQLGVADYLVKPIAPAMLRRSISFGGMVGDTARPSRNGKTVAVVGARGGVGTTSVACNIGWHLATGAARRTLVCDLDVHHGPVNMMFDLKQSMGLINALQDPSTLGHLGIERVTAMKSPRLFTLTSEIGIKNPTPVTAEALQQLNAVLINHFHFVVLDCPWHSGEVLNSLMETADYVVTVVDPSMFAVRNLTRIARLRDRRNQTQRTILVANNIRPKSGESLAAGAMEAALGRKIDHTLPFTATLLKSQNLGRFQDQQPAPYKDVVAEIVRDITNTGERAEPREEPNSLWKRMFS